LKIQALCLIFQGLVSRTVKLYELGRLSSGRAADLAGMTRVEFLLSLNRYRVFPLASELEELEEAHAGDLRPDGLQLLPQSLGRQDRPSGLVEARGNFCSRSCRKFPCQKRGHAFSHRLRRDFWMRAEGIEVDIWCSKRA
jgi:hypothetical protein